MRIGVPKEIKDNEFRVGLTPATVRELMTRGHQVLVEKGAGLGAGLADAEYLAAGAEVVMGAEDVFERSDLIVKVKDVSLGRCMPKDNTTAKIDARPAIEISDTK